MDIPQFGVFIYVSFYRLKIGDATHIHSRGTFKIVPFHIL